MPETQTYAFTRPDKQRGAQITKGWGHSSYEQAIEVAERVVVRQLIMTHHDPDHGDAFLRAVEKMPG